MKNKAYICVFLCFKFLLSGQHSLRFKRVNINDGLSQNTITSIIRDNYGFMWLGTQDGLNRYDGHEFKIYRFNENDTNSITNNYIISLAIDNKGSVWVGTTMGLNKIDVKTGGITRINLQKLFPGQIEYRINSVVSKSDGGVYFSLSHSLCSIDSLNNVRIVLTDKKEKILSVKKIIAVDSGLWIGAYNEIKFFNFKTKAIIRFSELQFKNESGADLLNIKNNLVYFQKNARLYIFNYKTQTIESLFSRYINAESTKNCISLSLYENETWIATENGLIWQNKNDTLVIKNIPGYDFSISSDFTYQVYKDKYGLYWIGTARGGLCLFNPVWQQFKIISKPLGLNEAVWNIVEKGDTLILATAKGLRVFKKEQPRKRLSSYFLPEQALTEIYLPTLQGSLKQYLTTALAIDANKNLWIGTENQGLYWYNFSTKKLKSFFSNPNDSANTISHNSIYHILNISATTIGLSTPYGYTFMDVNTHKPKRFYQTLQNKNVSNNYIIKSSKSGNNIWFSSAHGLCQLNLTSNVLKQFLPDKYNRGDQYYNILSAFYTDSKNQQWASSFGHGLFKFDSLSGNFEKYGAEYGLKNETILGILEDENNNLWLGTHDGIARFNTKTKSFSVFNNSNGLESKESTENGFYKGFDNDLYFGMISGLAVFNPEKVVNDTNVYPTVITDIKINYNTIDPNTSYIVSGTNFQPKKIVLNYNDKTITFEFACLAPLNAKELVYRYKLIGFNDKWITANSSGRYATYTNLSPNTYTFYVEPVLKNDTKSGLSFIIVVNPPYWQTWWFIAMIIILSVIIIAAGIFYYAQRKFKSRLRKMEEERKIQKEKERISRELHDNVGSQLTYIIKSLDNLSYKSIKENSMVHANLDALSEFSRDTLNQLRESIWAINSKSVSYLQISAKISEYINKLKNNFEKPEIQFETKFKTEFELNPAVAINLFRIIQEAINNSIKHANPNKITLQFIQINNSRVELLISDDGVGFSGHEKTSGYGLKNMKARADEIDAIYEIRTMPGRGTHIKLSFYVQEYDK